MVVEDAMVAEEVAEAAPTTTAEVKDAGITARAEMAKVVETDLKAKEAEKVAVVMKVESPDATPIMAATKVVEATINREEGSKTTALLEEIHPTDSWLNPVNLTTQNSLDASAQRSFASCAVKGPKGPLPAHSTKKKETAPTTAKCAKVPCIPAQPNSIPDAGGPVLTGKSTQTKSAE